MYVVVCTISYVSTDALIDLISSISSLISSWKNSQTKPRNKRLSLQAPSVTRKLAWRRRLDEQGEGERNKDYQS